MQPVGIALDAALVILQNGGSTVAAERSLTRILSGYQIHDVPVSWRLDLIAAFTTVGGESSAVLRPVGPIGVNLVRVSAVAALAERVAGGETDGAIVTAELARIRSLPAPYTRWVTVVAAAAAGAAFSQIPGGDWGSMAVAFVAAGAGQGLRSVLQSKRVAVAPVTLVCALLSACIASASLRLGLSEVVPATLIASVIYLAPGLPLINGFIDVAAHRFVLVGIERIVNAAYLFLVMTVAIALASTVIL